MHVEETSRRQLELNTHAMSQDVHLCRLLPCDAANQQAPHERTRRALVWRRTMPQESCTVCDSGANDDARWDEGAGEGGERTWRTFSSLRARMCLRSFIENAEGMLLFSRVNLVV